MLTSRIIWKKVFTVFSEFACRPQTLVRNPIAIRGFTTTCRKSRTHLKFDCVRRFSSVITSHSSPEKPDLTESSNAGVIADDWFKDINYQEIVGNDEALLKKFKVILLEIDVMRQDGFRVPNKITVERWKELLNARSRSQRIKLLTFLFKTEKKKERDVMKKEEKKKDILIRKEEHIKRKEENNHIHYGFGGCTIFLRVYDTKIDELMNNKLISAMQFGQSLVLDCGYDEHMTPKEASLCAKQLMIVFAENRKHDNPFNLHYCNANPETKVITKLSGLIPTLYDDNFPLNITQKSYLDVFPKERLVYLTPHCREDLDTYSHDDVYIIGGMVDKVSNEQLSLGKAKKEGLRMARLPLDRHLLWHIGSKSLTLNQVLLVMLEMKESGNWQKAFTHIPRRKLLTEANTKPTKGPSLYRERMRNFNRTR